MVAYNNVTLAFLCRALELRMFRGLIVGTCQRSERYCWLMMECSRVSEEASILGLQISDNVELDGQETHSFPSRNLGRQGKLTVSDCRGSHLWGSAQTLER